VRRSGLWDIFWPLRGGVVFWSFWGPPLQSSFAMEKKNSPNCGAGSPGTVGWRLKGLIGDGLGELGQGIVG